MATSLSTANRLGQPIGPASALGLAAPVVRDPRIAVTWPEGRKDCWEILTDEDGNPLKVSDLGYGNQLVRAKGQARLEFDHREGRCRGVHSFADSSPFCERCGTHRDRI